MELRGDASSGRGQYQAMHWRRPAGGNENRGNSSAIVASISSPPTRSRVYSKNVPGRKTPSLDWRRKAESSRGAMRGSPCASVASVSSQPMTKTNVSNPRAPFDSGREQHRSSTMMNQGDRSNANNVSSEVRSLMTETPACPWIPPMKQPEIEYDRSKLRYVASEKLTSPWDTKGRPRFVNDVGWGATCEHQVCIKCSTQFSFLMTDRGISNVSENEAPLIIVSDVLEMDRVKEESVEKSLSQSAGEKLVGRKEKSVSHGHSDDPLLVMLWALMTNTRGAKPVDHLLRGDVWHRKLSVAEIEEILEDYPGLFAKEVGEFTSCEKDAYSAELPDTNTSCGEDKEKFPIVKLLPDFQLCKDYFSESGCVSKQCRELHMCRNYAIGFRPCKDSGCRLEHSADSKHNSRILRKVLELEDLSVLPEDLVLDLICFCVEKWEEEGVLVSF